MPCPWDTFWSMEGSAAELHLHELLHLGTMQRPLLWQPGITITIILILILITIIIIIIIIVVVVILLLLLLLIVVVIIFIIIAVVIIIISSPSPSPSPSPASTAAAATGPSALDFHTTKPHQRYHLLCWVCEAAGSPSSSA